MYTCMHFSCMANFFEAQNKFYKHKKKVIDNAKKYNTTVQFFNYGMLPVMYQKYTNCTLSHTSKQYNRRYVKINTVRLRGCNFEKNYKHLKPLN